MSSTAALSMGNSAASLQYQVSLAVADKAMEASESIATEMLDMLPQQQQRQSAPPLGQYIDVYA